MCNISYNFQGLMAIETKDWDAHDGRIARCCQTDSNQSQFVAKCRHLCRTKLTPLSESSGAVGLEIVSAVE